jgi:DNA-3-methyladenine glycosylase II
MMYKVIDGEVATKAATYLAKADPLLTPVIATHGLCTFRPHREYYRELVESIIGQQLSVKAAAAIETRFIALFNDTFPTPEQILSVTVEDLRAIGFSRPKAGYVQDLAAKVLAGEVKFDHLDDLSNEEVIAELTAVKGIGEWTVHMFLMFCMGRMDVLPTGDLGIRNGVQKLYGLAAVPTPDEVKKIAQKHKWHPYESIASWYIWQSLKNEPIQNRRELAR